VIFAVIGVMSLAIDRSRLMDLPTLWGLGQVRPSVAAVVVAYVALLAPRSHVLWAAWLLGLIADLVAPAPSVVLVGPLALGFVAGAFAVLHARVAVFRRRVLTLAAMTGLLLLVAGAVAVVLETVRSWYPATPAPWDTHRPLAESARALGRAVYSALLALPVGWLLFKTYRWWGFEKIDRSPGTARSMDR
jgi:rod shape-determining protein MreD